MPEWNYSDKSVVGASGLLETMSLPLNMVALNRRIKTRSRDRRRVSSRCPALGVSSAARHSANQVPRVSVSLSLIYRPDSSRRAYMVSRYGFRSIGLSQVFTLEIGAFALFRLRSVNKAHWYTRAHGDDRTRRPHRTSIRNFRVSPSASILRSSRSLVRSPPRSRERERLA